MRAVDMEACKSWRKTRGYRPRHWTHSSTCQTPLDNLTCFVKQILLATGPLTEAGILVHPVLAVNRLAELRERNDIPEPLGVSPFHVATTHIEIEALLWAALADPVDFSFFPVPKSFVLSADHDEYTTFFGVSKASINRVVGRLRNGQVNFVADYEAKQP